MPASVGDATKTAVPALIVVQPAKRKYALLRNCIAFWIFGLANNFGYVVMLSSADDILQQDSKSKNETTAQCEATVDQHVCKLGSLGIVLLADIIPSLIIKTIGPFCLGRVPMGIRHMTVCGLQTMSFLIVAFSTSTTMSLVGVTAASAAAGLGEISYLSLTGHYADSAVSAWSSGTGGAGIAGAIAYAALREPHFANLSARSTMFVMLSVPVVLAITYYLLLTPVSTVYKITILNPSSWIVPRWQKPLSPTDSERSGQSDAPTLTATESFERDSLEDVASPPLKPIDEMTFGEKLRLVRPLLRYMIPLAIVYFGEYEINQGLTAFLIFDCSHGFHLSQPSQYRWYQVIYQIGVFISRSSVNIVRLPIFVLYLLPILQLGNAIFFLFDSLFSFIPHIGIVFGLILFEGLFGGASYVNSFFRVHQEAPPAYREFFLSFASMADNFGILSAGFSSIAIHNWICNYKRLHG